MSKNIPVKNRVAVRLDALKKSEDIENYSELIEMILNKVEPLLEADR